MSILRSRAPARGVDDAPPFDRGEDLQDLADLVERATRPRAGPRLVDEDALQEDEDG